MKRLGAVLGKVNLPNWCFIVVRHGGNAYRDAYSILQQTLFFFALSRWLGSSLHTIDPLREFSFLRCYQVLVWNHCHHVFTSCSARQSRPLLFFPRGCIFSMVKTIACCPCHFVRVSLTLAVGKVTKIARWCPPGLSHCCATHFGSH